MSWKTVAIIFIILFTLETSYLIWGLYLVAVEDRKTETCFYEICSKYPDASIEGNICSCMDYDVLGELQVVETKVIR
jgi:hypothetical protein